MKKLLLATAAAVSLSFSAAHAGTYIAPVPGFLYSTAGCDYLWLPGYGWGSFRAGTMNPGGTDAQNVQKVQEWSEIIQSIEMANMNLPPTYQRVIQVLNGGQDASVCGNYTIITGLVP